MCRGDGDEFLALLAHLFSSRSLFSEMAGGRRVGFLARVVEAFPQRLGNLRVLLVELLPFVAQVLHFDREARRCKRKRGRGLGTFAELNAGLMLPERFPALELRELLRHAAEPLQGGLRQQPGIDLARPDFVDGGADGLQLPSGQRLLRRMQESVHMLPRAVGFLLRGTNLREAPLLDLNQRGFEARRQHGRSHVALERLPAFRQLGVVNRSAGRELLGFHNERFGAGQRVQFLCPPFDAPIRFFELLQCRSVGVIAGRFAQCRELAQHSSQNVRGSGRILRQPLVQTALEACARALLFMLAIEARLQCKARSVATCKTRRIVVKLERLPTTVEIHHRRENRTGLVRQCLQLVENRIRLGGAALAVRNGIDPFARETRYTAILVFRGVGELAQAVLRMHAFGRCQTSFCVRGAERKFDERSLPADRSDRAPAPLCIRSGARNLGTDGIGASVGPEEFARLRGVDLLCKHACERGCDCKPNGGVGLLCPRGRKRSRVLAPIRRGKADLGRRVTGEKRTKLVGLRRQLGDAGQPPRRVGVEMRRGTKEAFGDHGGRCPREDSIPT